MVDSIRDEAEELIEGASEAIDESSATVAKHLEDNPSH